MTGVLVTGASGAVGSIVLQAAADAGGPARALAREPDTGGWQAPVRAARAELPGALTIVHSAIPPQPRSASVMARYDRETVRLFDLAQELGVGLVVVSTLSIHPGNPSYYVAHKRATEALARRRGGAAVRLGLVRAEGPNAAYQRIRALTRRVPARIITTPLSVYYVTTGHDIRLWAMEVALGSEPRALVHACADPRPRTLFEAVDLPAPRSRAWHPPGFGSIPAVGLYRSRLVAATLGPVLDPVVNLRAGMGWVDDGS